MRPAAPPLFLAASGDPSPDDSPFRSVLRTTGLLLTAAMLSGCPTPPTPRDKAGEAAEELNQAARWGRLDIALRHSSAKDKDAFLHRHARWNNGLRIVDTEMAGLAMNDPKSATVQVDVSWILDEDTNMRLTRLEQRWENDDGRWEMVSERRIGGALGLFGEKISHANERKDTHFPTKTIRSE